jgi:O-antigen/teichoic acid export membrane protein
MKSAKESGTALIQRGGRLFSRLAGNRYLSTLATGYVQLTVLILVSLAQVPLVLAYLGKEQFGIWALAAQAAVWLQLVDGGMNGALARYLIDYRNDSTGLELRKCLATGLRVLGVQGLVVFGLAAGVGVVGEAGFGLSAAEAGVFQRLMLLLGASAAIGFAGKVAQSWLYGSQRLDLANLIGLVLAPGEFALIWLLLHCEAGVTSLAWARLGISVAGVTLCWWVSVRWVAFPWRLLAAGWDAVMFRRLAMFGGGMFLLTMGGLLLTMTQTAMTAKYLGLAAAAVWATAPKVFQLAQQLVCRLWDYRIPYLSALMAEERKPLLTREFLVVFGMTAYVGGGIGGVLAAINPLFLKLWTGGVIEWEPVNDLLMGLLVYAFLLIRCVTDFVLHTKKVGLMPVLMCGEGLLFVVVASRLLPVYGLPGMLAAALLFGGLLRLPYAWGAFRKYLGVAAPPARLLVFKALSGAGLGAALWALLKVVSLGVPAIDLRLLLLVQAAVAAGVLGPIFFRLVLALRKA